MFNKSWYCQLLVGMCVYVYDYLFIAVNILNISFVDNRQIRKY